MSYWTLPEGSVDGELTRVLSPDDVMGGVVCAEAIREANTRTSEKPAVKREVNATCAARCFFNRDPPIGKGAFTPQTLTTACLE